MNQPGGRRWRTLPNQRERPARLRPGWNFNWENCMDNRSDFDALLARIAHLKTHKESRGAKEIARDGIIDQLTALLHSSQRQIDALTASNRELVRLSNTDGLTALYNHRFMMERCNLEFDRAKRYKSGLCCVLIDIDNFKLFNDTYGHQFGDFVLKQLGALIKDTARSSDICGRYGGEEFIILISRPLAEAKAYVLRLHTAIAEHLFADGENSAGITVSIGLADYRPEMQNASEMIARADQLLYLAKNSGRNMVRIWAENNAQHMERIDNSCMHHLKKEITASPRPAKPGQLESGATLPQAMESRTSLHLTAFPECCPLCHSPDQGRWPRQAGNRNLQERGITA